jgi:hypothetical protein
MTLPFERTYSVINTRQFLLALLNKEKTPRVPKEIRRQARNLLKHYPTEFDLERAVEKSSDIFGCPKKGVQGIIEKDLL